jgi:hypothetical protein
MRKPISFEPLHSPTLVIHAYQDVWADRLDFGIQLKQLIPALPVPAKVNDTAYQRVFEATTVGFGEDRAFHINDEWGVGGGRRFVFFHCSVFERV